MINNLTDTNCQIGLEEVKVCTSRHFPFDCLDFPKLTHIFYEPD